MTNEEVFLEKEYYRQEIIRLIHEIDRSDVLLYLYVFIKGTKKEMEEK